MNNQQEFEQLRERQTSSEEIYNGVILHVYKDGITLPDGKKSTRELIRHIGAVCVIPVTDEGEVIVEHQFRYPLNKVITEIPAGKLDSKDEDPLLAAQRELREETGYTADEWTDIGIFYSACAYSDEKIHMYMARKLHEGSRHLDEGEFINVRKVPIEELVQQVMNGEIGDSKTQVAILKAARILGK